MIFGVIERSLGFIFFGLVNFCRVLSGKLSKLIFKSFFDFRKETRVVFFFFCFWGWRSAGVFEGFSFVVRIVLSLVSLVSLFEG